jgi:hypothetical protein
MHACHAMYTAWQAVWALGMQGRSALAGAFAVHTCKLYMCSRAGWMHAAVHVCLIALLMQVHHMVHQHAAQQAHSSWLQAHARHTPAAATGPR